MSLFAQRVAEHGYNVAAAREGLSMVRRIMAAQKDTTGLTTSELYRLVQNEKPSSQYSPYKFSPAPVRATGNLGNSRKAPPAPPKPEHPVRSMTFLKTSVLRALERNRELKVVQAMRVPSQPAPAATFSTPAQASIQAEDILRGNKKSKKSKQPQPTPPPQAQAAPTPQHPVKVWVWQLVDHSSLTSRTPSPPQEKFGAPVGQGADVSHLNRRRRRARMGKIRRDVWAMKDIQKTELEAQKAELMKRREKRLARKKVYKRRARARRERSRNFYAERKAVAVPS